MLAVTTIFLLGFDSLVAAAALGPLAHRRSRWILVGLFGGCDGLATLVGEMGLFRLPHLAVGLVPVALACYGVYLMAVSGSWGAQTRADWYVHYARAAESGQPGGRSS